MNITKLFGIRLSNRRNTRRNRARAFQKWIHQSDSLAYTAPPPIPEEERDANRIRGAAHLAENIARGVTLKAYSAWSGTKVRVLSKRLDDFNHRRLPGQREVKP